MKINSIIIDDELPSREVLRSLLGKFCPEINILAEAETASKGHELLKELKPDLIFLDIQMPNENGFDLLKRFKKIDFDVIFVTSFNQYAISAIKFSALDYLLKPVEVTDLKAAVQKAVQRAEEKADHAPLIINLLNNIDEAQKEKKIPLHAQGKVRFINITDISHFEAEINYTHVLLNNGEKITVSRTLSDFENILEQCASFIRINKSVIVNSNCIDSYSKNEPCVITLKNGKIFEISRRKKQDVLKILKEK